VKPGDSIEIGLGMAYALNEKLSTSLSYQQRYYFKTEQNGKELADTDFNVASVNFGVNHAITERVSVSVSVGVGLTNDAADTTVEIRLPIRF
jgi:opacity protein-like surface antigen